MKANQSTLRRSFDYPKVLHLIQLVLCIMFAGLLHGQVLVEDDFSDADLTSAPAWEGDVANFTVTDQRLQLDTDGAGSSVLFTPYSWDDSLRFRIDVDLLFGPSNDNQLGIYLCNGDITAQSEALYLEVGESGSDDAFALFTTSESGSTEIHRFATVPHTSVRFLVGIEVEHAPDGSWTFRFDHGLDGSIDDEQTVDLAFSIESTCYFGLQCDYTSSRADRFFFDNVLVEKIVADVIPPSLVRAEALAFDKVELVFDEAIDGASLGPNQFQINPGDRMPSSVLWDENSPERICLQFSSALTNDETYTVTISNMQDQSGNIAAQLTGQFDVLFAEVPAFGDVIINEIHAAPSTNTALPNVEFVEVFNRSNKIINLAQLRFTDASSSTALAEVILRPDDYAIICDEADVALFSDIQSVVDADNFPSLNNGGDVCQLLFETEVIDRIAYSQSWYQDDNKLSGYSLERMNPESACIDGINWRASDDPTGGTPGELNSIYTPEEPTGVAELSSMTIVDTRTVQLNFDLQMDAVQLLNQSNYSIEPSVQIASVELLDPNNVKSIRLNLGEELQPGTIYTLTLNTNICFCNGMKWDSPIERSFGLPELPEAGDVVVSEILFSPFSGEAEFIEIANRSNKVLRSIDLWLSYVNLEGNFWARKINQDFLLLPGSYYVVTDNRQSVLDRYTVPFSDQVFSWDIPSLTNAGGFINIFYFDGNLDSVSIDAAAYSPDWHDPLLDDDRGVSLERLALANDGLDQNNWYSSATIKGGATPTGENSQQISNSPTSDNFSMHSPTFSPDGDGFEDVMVLNYTFDAPGYIANVRIFSHDGVLVKTLVSNASLGREGQLLWAGNADDGSMSRVGIYYVLIKAYEVNGKTVESKQKIVLARQL